MYRSRKLLFAAALLGTATFGIAPAHATDIDVDATMTASAAVTVAKDADMDFGGIDFVTGHSGTIELGPDGNAALGGGSSNLTLTGTPAAGELSVTSSSGVLEITCDQTGIISDGAIDLSISAVVWDTSAAATYGGATNICAGLGTSPVVIDTGTVGDPTLYIGGELTIGSNVLDASSGSTPFNTTNTNGDPITFRFVFQ